MKILPIIHTILLAITSVHAAAIPQTTDIAPLSPERACTLPIQQCNHEIKRAAEAMPKATAESYAEAGKHFLDYFLLSNDERLMYCIP